MRETNPTRSSAVLSVTFSIFRACFREFWMDRPFYLADSGRRRPTKPNKPNEAKTIVINNMNEKSTEQTQRTYHTFYAYSDFDADFQETWMEGTWLSIGNSDAGGRAPDSGERLQGTGDRIKKVRRVFSVPCPLFPVRAGSAPGNHERGIT